MRLLPLLRLVVGVVLVLLLLESGGVRFDSEELHVGVLVFVDQVLGVLLYDLLGVGIVLELLDELFGLLVVD